MPKNKIIPLNKSPPEKIRAPWSVDLNHVTIIGGSRTIIDDVSGRLSASGISVIMGENGAGKSMLLKAMAGLVRPQSGHVRIHCDMAGRTAMVFQTPVLLRRSVGANLIHALKIAGINHRRRRRQDMLALLEICGLKSMADQPARQLSGGEQQRLQMARALASNPKLLLMDEPTSNLDPQSSLALEHLIRSTSQSGVKIVLVTHNLGQAKRLANEALFVSQGHLVEQGHASSLFSNPRTAAFRAYLEGEIFT